jgi:hypothetical protein
MTSAEIGALAAHRAVTVHELVPMKASLEDAFMELTHDAVEYRTADQPRHMAVLAPSGQSPLEAS